jgi:glycosyltransferase involved in cell wall biosynthesis
MIGKINFVSVIIPACNAGQFIEETLKSIFSQTHQHWEIIVIDDGSTDNTVTIINSFRSNRIKLISQENSGVAAARNKGLLYANGEFVVFFDADDLMSPDFLSVRVNALLNDREIGYAGGLVEFFPNVGKTKKAAASDPVDEILFFNSSFGTTPSNYIFKAEILATNKIFFNTELNSSADRFFILEVSKYAKGKYIADEKGLLLYRFNSQSMSNNVTPGLIKDNEKFYYELKRKNLLPASNKQKFKSIYFLSLAKGFGMIKHWKNVVKYLFMAFINHPLFFAASFGKKLIEFPYLMISKTKG